MPSNVLPEYLQKTIASDPMMIGNPDHRRDYVNKRLVGKNSIEYWHNTDTKANKTKEGPGAGRDLIKEYFARTRNSQEPPPIFRNPRISYFNSQSVDDMELEAVLNFVDENFKEIGVSSVIIPEKKPRQQEKKDGYKPIPAIRKSESCHLIGKVNPNILRTWEQLNQNNDEEMKPQEHFFQRTNFQAQNEDLASFKVNYVTYDRKEKRRSSTDDLYYDSIDEDELDTASLTRSIANVGGSIIFRGDQLGQQSSLMTDNNDDLYMNGGEGIAEFDSLDKKRLNCWSPLNDE